LAAFGHIAKALLDLTKPRALVMITFTTGLGYLIAVTTAIDWRVLAHLVFGVVLSSGGSLALNQYMERDLDARMERTRHRPIPSGRISARAALVFGTFCSLVGYGHLALFVNLTCSLATIACGTSYLFLYTPLKLRSSFSSFVGAIPGGLLPVMGWAAARGRLELGAWVLFVILFLWQIPHALIISIRHSKDYQGVGMKQLPIITDSRASRRQMVFNVLVLIPVTVLPGFLNMTEDIYPVIALALGFLLLNQVLQYTFKVTEQSAKRVFIALSAYLPLLLLAMYLDKPV